MAIDGVDTTHYNLTGKTLAANSKAFVCRYVQNAPGSTLDKELRLAELVEKAAAGIRVVANWEWEAAPPNSRSRGQQDANRWLARKAALGIPGWAPCYYSIDTGAQAGSYDAYAQGWLDEVPREQLGVYGDGALFRQLKADGFVTYAWQSMSRSFPGNHLPGQPDVWDHRGADIVQTTSAVINRILCDLDYATVDNYGGFLLGEEDPNMTPDDVKTLLHTDGIIPNPAWRSDSPDYVPPGTNEFIALQTLLVDTGTNAANAMHQSQLNAAAIADLRAAIAALPTTALPAAPIDYAALAKAVNDDAAKRLAS